VRRLIVGVVTGFVLWSGVGHTAFALDLSVGGGGYYGGNFGAGIEENIKITVPPPYRLSASRVATTYMPVHGGGVYGFFDAGFAELSVGLFLGRGTWETKADVKMNGIRENSSGIIGDISTTELNMGLLLKIYPETEHETVKIFYGLGMDYQMCVSAEFTDIKIFEKPDRLDRLWFKAGAGADLYLSEKFFIRPVALYGIGLESRFEKEFCSARKNQVDYTEALELGATVDANVETKLSHGLTVKVSVGYVLLPSVFDWQ
jgi:hypothetical protein